MSSGAQFVVAAYAVILFALVMYVVVLALKSARIAREVELLSRILDRDRDDPASRTDDAGGAVSDREPEIVDR